MAHPNLDARRARVRALLDEGMTIDGAMRRSLAAEYGCSHTAISADVIALTHGARETIHIGAAMRKRIIARDGGVCQYCGRADDPYRIVEHVIPAALGGVARPYNLVVACSSCNVRKGRAVWVPRNVDTITLERPGWRECIERMAGR